MHRKSDVEIPHILLSAYTPTDFIANTLRALRSVGMCVWMLCSDGGGGGGGGSSARSTIYSLITMNSWVNILVSSERALNNRIREVHSRSGISVYLGWLVRNSETP